MDKDEVRLIMQRWKRPSPNTFKDGVGRYRTTSLFRELNKTKGLTPLFTFKDEVVDGCIPFGKIYVEISDPTGYEQAIFLLGSFKHWETLCGLKWFNDRLKDWNRELEQKLKSESWKEIADLAHGVPKEGRDKPVPVATRLSANKYIHQFGVNGAMKLNVRDGKKDNTKNNKRGRPSKEEQREYLVNLQKDLVEIDKDFERVLGDDS